MESKFGQKIWAHFQVLLHIEWGFTIYNHQRKTITLVVGSMCSIFHNTRKQFKIHVRNTNKTSGLSRLVQITTTTVLFCCNLLSVATCQCYQTATDSTTTLLNIISPDKERTVQSDGCCFWLFHTQPNQLFIEKTCNQEM